MEHLDINLVLTHNKNPDPDIGQELLLQFYRRLASVFDLEHQSRTASKLRGEGFWGKDDEIRDI